MSYKVPDGKVARIRVMGLQKPICLPNTTFVNFEENGRIECLDGNDELDCIFSIHTLQGMSFITKEAWRNEQAAKGKKK